MTHSLHREGSPDALDRDYVLFIYPSKGFNYRGSAPKVRRLAELIARAGPANLIAKTRRRSIAAGGKPGEAPKSVTVEGTSAYCIFNFQERQKLEIIEHDGTRVYSVFDSREKLKEALIRIKEADEGISIVVSGKIDRVREIAKEIGIDPYMINLSLGIHGKTERLPPADIRECTTMCGHGLVSPNLVRDTIRRVKTGKVGLVEGCEILAEPCICGIHNPSRSADLIRENAPLYAVDRW
jgi:ribosomal protein L20A (L18A)